MPQAARSSRILNVIQCFCWQACGSLVTQHPNYSIPDGTHRTVSWALLRLIAAPLSLCNSSNVWCHADAYATSYRGFVFSKPAETDAKQATGLNFAEGTWRLGLLELRSTHPCASRSLLCALKLTYAAQVLRAMFTGGHKPMQQYVGSAATNESIPRLPEGKKVRLHASR